MPKIGAHVSAAVSLETSFVKAQEIGAEATQIFVSPPRQWTQTTHDSAEIDRFKKMAGESGISPTFIHGTYLISLGTADPQHLKKSEDWLIYALTMADTLGCRGVIFHLGSHKGVGFDAIKDQVILSLKKILDSSPGSALLLLENSAGAGGVIGSNFHDLGILLKGVNNPRLKICLDTQHAFAAGYDLRTALGINDVLQEFSEEIGIENLAAIHANDSKTEYKSNRDRHENIGEGFIGKEGFEVLVNHPLLAEVPFLLEVPGFSENGPDKENVDLLKSLRQS